MYIKFLSIISVLVILGFGSCTEIVCGKPSGKQKQFIDSINQVNEGVFVGNQKSCFPGMFELHLKIDIDNIENHILNRKEYVDVFIYDKEENLIRGNPSSL